MEEITDMRNGFMSEFVQKCFLYKFLEAFARQDQDIEEYFDFLNACMPSLTPQAVTLPKIVPDMNQSYDDYLQQCLNKHKGNDGKMEPEYPDGEVVEEDSNHTLEAQCVNHINDFLISVSDILTYSQPAVRYLTDLSSIYNDTVTLVFNDTGHNITEYPQHEECASALAVFDTSYRVTLKDAMSVMSTLLSADNYDSLSLAVADLHEMMRQSSFTNFSNHIGDLDNR